MVRQLALQLGLVSVRCPRERKEREDRDNIRRRGRCYLRSVGKSLYTGLWASNTGSPSRVIESDTRRSRRRTGVALVAAHGPCRLATTSFGSTCSTEVRCKRGDRGVQSRGSAQDVWSAQAAALAHRDMTVLLHSRGSVKAMQPAPDLQPER